MRPSEKTSLAWQAGSPRTCSGARNRGVPKSPFPCSARPRSAVSSGEIGRLPRRRRASPKSRTLTRPSAVTITFSGLRSPCTMLAAWAAAIPEAIWRAIEGVDSSGSCSPRASWLIGCPEIYSIEMMGTPAVSSTA